MKAEEAMHHLERRRREMLEEIRSTEEACQQVGDQLAELRRLRAWQELQLHAVARALDALRRDDMADAREAV